MPCNKPCFMRVYSDGSQKYVGRPKAAYRWPTDYPVSCNQCMGCRLETTRDWAVRLVHEASLYDQNSFITLTLDPEHLPADNALDVRHWQLFAKRLRDRVGKFRFFHCGEYGDQKGRPHYHAALFGQAFLDDRQVFKTGPDYTLWTSELLTDIWGMGHCIIGNLTYESAAYVARYITKKQNGDSTDEKYLDEPTGVIRPREYTTMSRNPGLGSDWLAKYGPDVYPGDFVVINGREQKPPRYYDRQFKKAYPEAYEAVRLTRVENALDPHPDSFLERREIIMSAAVEQQLRSVE